jgi:hypothetical protein
MFFHQKYPQPQSPKKYIQSLLSLHHLIFIHFNKKIIFLFYPLTFTPFSYDCFSCGILQIKCSTVGFSIRLQPPQCFLEGSALLDVCSLSLIR